MLEEELPNIGEDVRFKIQEFLSSGMIDDLRLLAPRPPLRTMELYEKPQFDMTNPAQLYQEAFKSALDVRKF